MLMQRMRWAGLVGAIAVLIAMAFAATGHAQGDVTPTRTPVALKAPGLTVTPTPTAQPTAAASDAPAVLPATFIPPTMYSWARPATYVTDTCEYLQQRWNPDNSAPGTIVVPVMYHRIRPQPGMHGIPEAKFRAELAEARQMGFETVTAEQVADFLEHNAPIPPRSLLLIVDDRRAGIIERYFMPLLEAWDWTVTSAWIIANTDDIPNLWERMEALNESGRVDVQSHGLRHLYMIPGTPEQKMREELFDPIPIHEQHFGYRPTAFIWPGGNFHKRAVEIAREAGYRIGFTIFVNGPVMYNWIPQGKSERAIGDPLMLLPRYWGGRNLVGGLRDAAAMGDAARANALASFPQEAAYYRAHCGGELPAPAE